MALDSDIMKEYLVKLGIDIDSQEVAQWGSTLKNMGNTFEQLSLQMQRSDEQQTETFKGSMVKLLKRTGIIVGAFKAAGASIYGFLNNVAKSDSEMKRFATSMYLSTERAKSLQNTLDSMDMSMGDLRDIAYNPELLQQYKEFLHLSRSFKAPEGLRDSFMQVRSINKEFQKTNLIFKYFKENVAHFIFRTAQAPATKFKKSLKEFNDRFSKNIIKWAETLGSLIGNVLRLSLRLGEVIKSIGKVIGSIWDQMNSGLKLFTIGVTGLVAFIKMGPLGRLLSLMTVILAFIDDYKTYKEGGISAEWAKPMWEFVDEQREDPESFYNSAKVVLKEIINTLNYIANLIGDALRKLGLVNSEERFSNDTILQSQLLNPDLLPLYNLKIGESKEEENGLLKTNLVLPQSHLLDSNNPTNIGSEIGNKINFKVPSITEDLGDNRILQSTERLKSQEQKQKESITNVNNDNSRSITNNQNSNPINQTFNFNLESNSLESPNTFFEEVSTLLRNNKGVLVGG